MQAPVSPTWLSPAGAATGAMVESTCRRVGECGEGQQG